MKIMKFGGTSVGSAEAIKQVIAIVKNDQANVAAVVVSAMTKVTDQLLAMARLAAAADGSWHKTYREVQSRHREVIAACISQPETKAALDQQVQSLLQELESILWGIQLVRELTPKMLDVVASFGERLSALIIAGAFTAADTPAIFTDSRELIVTNTSFGQAAVLMTKTQARITRWWKKQQSKKILPIVTGFIGATEDGSTTTLGRGGSDYTVSLMGAMIGVRTIEIWTDVNGVMTADPRKVPAAHSIDSMTYEEAMELSHFGAKVIYPPTMRPALEKNIPLVIKNTFHPEFSGTIISKQSSAAAPIKGISALSDVAMVQLSGSGMVGVPGVAARLFGALAACNVNIILITQASSEHTICFAILPKDVDKATTALSAAFTTELREAIIDPVEIDLHRSIIAIVGEQMRRQPGISGKVFSALGAAGINVEAIAQGSSERIISLVVTTAQEQKAVQAIHQTFFP